jgi:hypothetical protein
MLEGLRRQTVGQIKKSADDDLLKTSRLLNL